jgi:BrxA
MKSARDYTTQLGAGLGVLAETRVLLDLWAPGMTGPALEKVSLGSGRFPRMAARRLHNLVKDCFARRYLVENGRPALWLRTLAPVLSPRAFEQMAFLYTCRANEILADFVTEVYWPQSRAGQDRISNQEGQEFVSRANKEGRTAKPWSDSTIRRVAGYLTGACADFGLLERGTRKVRKIVPFRLEAATGATLAYDLHFSGLGDNALVAHRDWALFGLELTDVLAELKRLSLMGLLIVQMAGSVISIAWKCKNLEELAHALAQG